jgi:hypothetical protein
MGAAAVTDHRADSTSGQAIPRSRLGGSAKGGVLRSLASVTLVLALAGCGEVSARLYVSQAGGTAPVDTAPNTDAISDVGRSDLGGNDAEVDVPDGLLPEAGLSDTTEADAEADASELEPACAEIDERLEFGERIFGEDHEEIIRVRNCGGFEAENLVIEAVEFVNDAVIQSSPELTLSGTPELPFALLPNEAWPFPVRYSPTEAGEHSGVVRFTTNGLDAATVDVSVSASVR